MSTTYQQLKKKQVEEARANAAISVNDVIAAILLNDTLKFEGSVALK